MKRHPIQKVHEKRKWYDQFDIITLLIGIPIMGAIVYLFHIYVIDPVSINLQLNSTVTLGIRIVVFVLFFGGWFYLSRKETVESEIDLAVEAEQTIESTGDTIGAHLSPEEAFDRFTGLIRYIEEKIADDDWDEAWAYYEQAEDILHPLNIPNKSAYYEKLYQLKTQIEKERTKENKVE